MSEPSEQEDHFLIPDFSLLIPRLFKYHIY